MSKIHEALRKAEQEKLAVDPMAATVQSVFAEDHSVLAEAPPTPVRAAAHSAMVLPGPANPAQPLTWDTIVARCPQREWKATKGMLFLNKNNHDDVGMEEFRTLRSRLYHLREKQPLKTILIGSALPAEGKSFVSANLAQTLARQHGRRVVLMDCDLRRSRLHETLGTAGEPGVSDYLRGTADELSIMQRGPMENLVFIPAGNPPSNPAELIGNGRLEVLLKRLAAAFDWIVVDSPPAVPVSDAGLIGRWCDGVLLVVLAAKTPFDLAQRARHEFSNMTVLGAVLNRVEAGSTYTSYYYGAYGKPGEKA
jgi:protein-tyrosine kinase